ncbi:MAG: hypothetical protein GX786_10510 [Clostridiales bacterium]|nr:hypothetical protein [Clostridiales bacterium]
MNELEGYPCDDHLDFQFHQQGEAFDFIHLFVTMPKKLAQEIAEAERLLQDGGLYPREL